MRSGGYTKQFLNSCLSSKHQSLRWKLFAIAFILCLLILFSGATASLIVMHNKDYDNELKARRRENAIEDIWSARFRDVMIGALTASNNFEGYIMSDLKTLPNISDPPDVRVRGQLFPKFPILASSIARENPTIVLQTVSPGGAVSFTYPRNEIIEGIDMFSESYYQDIFGPTPKQTMLLGSSTFNGPWHTQLPSGEKLWTIQICQPVYNASGNESNLSLEENFWGFVTISLNVSDIIRDTALDKHMKAEGMDYLLYSMYQNGTVVEVASSLGNRTKEEIDDFIRTSTGNLPLLHSFAFTLAVKTHHLDLIATNATVTILLSVILLACVVLFAVLSALIIFCTQEHDELKDAPKAAPFAIFVLGPTNGENLWSLNSKEMDIITEKLNTILAKHAKLSHAYSSQQLQPYTHSYVFRRVDDAVRMAFAIMSELRCRPIDKSMQGLFGEEGQLLLAYAVHWCVDASVRPNPYASSGYLYDGPDVVYGGRMWMFAVPNVITLSESAKEALKRTSVAFSTVAYVCSTVIKDIKGPLYFINCFPFEGSFRMAMPNSSATKCGLERGTPMAVKKKMSSLEPSGSSYYQQSLNLMDTTKEGVPSGCVNNLADQNESKRLSQCSSAFSEWEGNPKESMDKFISLHKSSQLQDAKNVFESEAAMVCIEPNSRLSPLKPCDGTHTENGQFACTQMHEDVHSTSTMRVDVQVNDPNVSVSSGSNLQPLVSSIPRQTLTIASYENDAVSMLLLHPNIPTWQNAALQSAFGRQAVTVKLEFKKVRLIIYYFFSCYKLLFRPLEMPERINIFKRLVTVFGVPEHDILENLAARCVIRYIKQRKEAKGPLGGAIS